MVTRGLMPPGSLDPLHALPRLPRRRCERLLANASRPRRRQDTHAKHALDCSEKIHRAANRPPPVTGLFQKGRASQPLFLGEWRHIAIEPSTDHLESKQGQPILQPVQGDEIAIPRHRLLAAEIALESEQRKRVESTDDEMALGTHGSIHLA